MSASDHINETLFHGTNALLDVGDKIHALAPSLLGNDNEPVANAISDFEIAKDYAKQRTMYSKKPQLFGAVYEVTPVENDPTDMRDGRFYLSKSGFIINKVHYIPWTEMQ